MNAPSSPEAAALPELPAALPLPSAQSSIVAKANAIAELAGAATPLIGMALRSTSNGKPGWQTTEFWLTAVALGLNILGATSGVLKPETAAMIGSLLTVAYAALRTVVKTTGSASTTLHGTPVATPAQP